MRISCIQMNMLPAEPDANFARAEELVRKAAAEEKPDVIVLPETWNTGFAPGRIDPALADGDGARTQETFSALGRELGVNIAAGSVASRRDGGLHNTAYVFDRAGNRIARYDKTHLFSPMGEDRAFVKGGSLCRFPLDGARCALVICYDIRFPELVRTLALPGLDVLFVVSQWPEQRIGQLETLSRARAIENQMFVSLCNSCGEAFGTRFGGRSAVIDPWGTALAEAGTGETTITADADLSVLDDIRGSIPVFRDRRPDLYDLNFCPADGGISRIDHYMED